jgi:hypothetical protein
MQEEGKSDMELFRQLSEEYSLIRVKGKVPLEKEWQQYCHKRRSFEEIDFQEGDNAGIACGPTSGVLVLDVDDPELFEKTCIKRHWTCPATRYHETGSGKFHFLYRYPKEKVYGNKAFKELGFDIRGVGGQVVAPGSIHPETGGTYKLGPDSSIVDPPRWILNLYSMVPLDNDGPTKLDPLSILAGVGEGERDEKLFKYACLLRRRDVSKAEAELLVCHAAANCTPRFSERLALSKVDQAWKRYGPGPSDTNDTNDTNGTNGTSAEGDTNRYKLDTNYDTNLVRPELSDSDKIRKWLDITDGVFHYTDVARDLRFKDTKNTRNILSRLLKENVIERIGTKSGTYQRIDTQFTPQKLFQSKDSEYRCTLPLGLSEFVKIQPGNLIVVAGDGNAAKTWFMLEFCRLNLRTHRIRYINSEMSDAELDGRLLSYGSWMDTDLWNRVDFGRVEKNYHHHILADQATVIDFIDIHKDFYAIGDILKSIHEKVGSGICVVALQKKKGEPLGKGGEATKEKSRLYVSLNLILRPGFSPYVMAYLEKVKLSRNPKFNANGLVRSFEVDLDNSKAITNMGDWRRAGKEDYRLMRGGW